MKKLFFVLALSLSLAFSFNAYCTESSTYYDSVVKTCEKYASADWCIQSEINNDMGEALASRDLHKKLYRETFDELKDFKTEVLEDILEAKSSKKEDKEKVLQDLIRKLEDRLLQ